MTSKFTPEARGAHWRAARARGLWGLAVLAALILAAAFLATGAAAPAPGALSELSAVSAELGPILALAAGPALAALIAALLVRSLEANDADYDVEEG